MPLARNEDESTYSVLLMRWARAASRPTWRSSIIPRGRATFPAKVDHIEVSGVSGPALSATLTGLLSPRGVMPLWRSTGCRNPQPTPLPRTRSRPRHPGGLSARRGACSCSCERRVAVRGAAAGFALPAGRAARGTRSEAACPGAAGARHRTQSRLRRRRRRLEQLEKV
jgi:hypothetical protein